MNNTSEIDLSSIPEDKKDIFILGFSRAVHVLRAFYFELIDKCSDNKICDFKSEFDSILPETTPGGTKITLNEKNYMIMYKEIDYKNYNLDTELAKIEGIHGMSPIEKSNFLREVDILASAIPSVNSKLLEMTKFQLLIKKIFNNFDEKYDQVISDSYKDITLKISENQRFYTMDETHDNGIVFGIVVDQSDSTSVE